MKIRLPATFIIIGLVIAISFFVALADIDAPHNESNNVSCGNCHGQGLLNSPFWGGSMSYDQLCQYCHTESSCPDTEYPEITGPLVQTHLDSEGHELAECRTCHDPHYQKQKNYKNTDASELYLAWGEIQCPDAESCPYDSENNTTTLYYSEINYKSESGWDASKLREKTNPCRRAILFPNVKKLGYSYPIVAIDKGEQTITVKGDARPVYQYIFSSDFAAMYGQFIKDTIEGGQVKVVDRKGDKSFATETLTGVCEVCHTQTMYHRNDGLGAPHYPAVRCTICHTHIDGFAPSDHTGTSGEDCEGCHGKDASNGGAGTTVSHSTHMENDADDLKGPNIECYDCHNIDSFPEFADGAVTLAATTVCNNCHSPGGAYNGVTMAKANWDVGIYESDGVNLRSGNKLWCATCHDENPAFSTSQLYEVVVDNPDAVFEGTWTTGSNTDQYGDSVQWNLIADPKLDSTATWRPDIPYSGQYSVYAWWTVHSNRATDAPYTIYYNGGSATVDVNQEINGGKWNYLGTYPFAEGTSGYVVLSDDSDQAGQYVIADAVKFLIGPQGIHAPKVIGDNSTYGYYATGHGAHDLVQCLHCHDASVTHIDHDARTYDAGVSDYCDSYRLNEIDGQPGLDVPRSSGGALANWRDFALCFECHDRYAVIGATWDDISKTNFWDADTSPNNSHWYHLGMGNNIYDSDYDSTTDSAPSCPTCHNVHGSPTGPMIRHGELISPYGTTSYVPSFNFYYLIAGDGSATATFTATGLSGIYDVYAWWTAHPNRATNAKYIINHDGGVAEVIKDQEQNGGQWNLLGRYDFNGIDDYVVLTSDGANEYIMADAVGWDSDLDGTPDIIVDDADAGATFQGTWTEASANPDLYGTSERYYYAPILDANASVSDSVGGMMASGGLNSNHSCGT
jgi:hypothetical protein